LQLGPAREQTAASRTDGLFLGSPVLLDHLAQFLEDFIAVE
jgi:hypothetical protein